MTFFVIIVFCLISFFLNVSATIQIRDHWQRSLSAWSKILGEDRIPWSSGKINSKEIERVLSQDFVEMKMLQSPVSSDPMNKGLSLTHFFVCLDHRPTAENSYESAKGILQQLNGVHVIRSDVESQESCFLLFDNMKNIKKTVMDIGRKSNQLLKSFGFLPQIMKIHQEALFAFSQETRVSKAAKDFYSAMNITNYPKKSATKDISRVEILIDFGLGNDKPMYQDVRPDLKTHIDSSTLNHKSLRHFAKRYGFLSSDHQILWRKSLEHLELHEESKQCDFSQLYIREHENGAIIRNLHRMVSMDNLHDLNRQQQHQSTLSSCYYSLLSAVSSHNHVVNIGIREQMKAFNSVGKSIIQSGSTNGPFTYTNMGLDGTGQVIGIGDTGLDDNHCLFRNSDGTQVKRSSYKSPKTYPNNRKVIQYINFADSGDGANGHGTHVSGTAAGNDINNPSNNYNGHASGAKIAFFDMGEGGGESIEYPQPISKYVITPAYNAGARVYSASWGSPYNAYSSDCISLDNFMYNYDDFLFVIAGGNEGFQGYFSIGDPGLSKNSLTVGCSEASSGNIANVAYFSSLGPTYDMRIKPDIVAPGFSTTSAAASTACGTFGMAGTSMSTPAVSGASLQIRQYFASSSFWPKVCNHSYPSCRAFSARGATVKAAIIHSGKAQSTYYASFGTALSTRKLSGTPDFFQGFGRVYLPNVLPSPISFNSFDLFVDENSITSLTSRTYTVRVKSKTADLKATLVWTDPPNSVISAKLLLNDLDLVVIDPNGKKYRGNGKYRDSTNNVEQVLVPSSLLIIGTYTVKVVGNMFSETTSQAYSLIITSPGYVSNIGKQSSIVMSDLFTLGCPSDSMEIWVEKFDHEGNGWKLGNNYTVSTQSSGSLVKVKTGTMSPGFYEKEGFCLPYGSYNVSLVQKVASTDMGMDIASCGLSLSRYQQTGSITVSKSGCNVCSAITLEVVLVGSFYGIQYGWHDTTSYNVINTDTNEVMVVGTLVSGIIDVHTHCLPAGSYSIGFSRIADHDDFNFFYDSSYDDYFGREEYYVSFSACGSSGSDVLAFKCDDNYRNCAQNYDRTSFTLSGSTSSNCNIHVEGEDDSSNSGLSVLSILIGLVLILSGISMASLVVKRYCKRNSLSSFQPVRTNMVRVVSPETIPVATAGYVVATAQDIEMTFPHTPHAQTYGRHVLLPQDDIPVVEARPLSENDH